MPRRGSIAKRDVLPDPLYNSKLVTRLINNVMVDGKRGVAQKIVYGAFDIIREKSGKEPLEVFEPGDGESHAPAGESRPAVSAAPPQVPIEVRPDRRQTPGPALADQRIPAAVPNAPCGSVWPPRFSMP